jgi:predicted DNA-binding transcriptional regulator YafY
MRELAWHLFTWGDKLRVLAPEILRRTLIDEIETARRVHASDSDAAAPQTSSS